MLRVVVDEELQRGDGSTVDDPEEVPLAMFHSKLCYILGHRSVERAFRVGDEG